MIATPPHDRKLGLVAVALVKERVMRKLIPALNRTREDMEKVVVSSGLLTDARFSWITISIRLGLKDDELPRYGRVSRKYGDLPLTIEIDTHSLLEADLEQAYAVFCRAVLRCLRAVSQKFDYPDCVRTALEKEGHNQPPQPTQVSSTDLSG